MYFVLQLQINSAFKHCIYRSNFNKNNIDSYKLKQQAS